MDDFLGVPVKITFSSEEPEIAYGVIEEIEAKTQRLTLKNAIVATNGRIIEMPIYNVFGGIIKDIVIITENELADAAKSSFVEKKTRDKSKQSLQTENYTEHQSQTKVEQRDVHRTDPAIISTTKSDDNVNKIKKKSSRGTITNNSHSKHNVQGSDAISNVNRSIKKQIRKSNVETIQSDNHSFHEGENQTYLQSEVSKIIGSKKPKNKSQQTQSINNGVANSVSKQKDHFSSKNKMKSENEKDSWANRDVSGYNDNEFDFEANLKLFDKRKIFDEIRSKDIKDPKSLAKISNADTTATEPETNKASSLHKKLNSFISKHNISVTKNNDFSQSPITKTSLPTSFPHSIKNSNIDINLNSISKNYSNHDNSLNDKSNSIQTLSVTPNQWLKIEQKLNKEVGIGEASIIEVSGKMASQVSMNLMKRLDTRNSDNDTLFMYTVLVVVGNGRNGLCGLACAKYLINMGCLVTVLLTFKEKDSVYLAYQQLKLVKFAGGFIIRSVEEIGNTSFDLIIDAIYTPNDPTNSYSLEKSVLGSDVNSEIKSLIKNKNTVAASIWAKKQKKSIKLHFDFPSFSLLSSKNKSRKTGSIINQISKPDSNKISRNTKESDQSFKKEKSSHIVSEKGYISDTESSDESVSSFCSSDENKSFGQKLADVDGSSGYNSDLDNQTKEELKSLDISNELENIISFGLPSFTLNSVTKNNRYNMFLVDIGIPFALCAKVLNREQNKPQDNVYSPFINSDIVSLTL
ncbi:hypothetical protein BB559_005234 [Furculomyces boomerangus]|uniref:Enhancer of mRNA-decapping protein 3 n=1 Tax=Furculomyces boomerangus TaxID=61424 RepID=A0A2T9Y9Y0_9FUNG|nr:hypothetical protein BB559_005234 [Furculomyces boomerangus]